MTVKEMANFLTAYAKHYPDNEVVTSTPDHGYRSIAIYYTEKVEPVKGSRGKYTSTNENNDKTQFVLVLE